MMLWLVPGGIDDERTGLGLADFIHLFAREHEAVFITGVLVERNTAAGCKYFRSTTNNPV